MPLLCMILCTENIIIVTGKACPHADLAAWLQLFKVKNGCSVLSGSWNDNFLAGS